MIRKMKGSGICPARPEALQIVTGLIGGISGIGAIAFLTQLAGVPLLMAPFGATCVLLFAAQGAPLAQPRTVIGGHFISALVGLVVLQLMGDGPMQMAIGVGGAIALMQLFRAVHPPAGANPLVIITAGVQDYSFLLTPVLAGSILLVIIALFINNIGNEKQWPTYWL